MSAADKKDLLAAGAELGTAAFGVVKPHGQSRISTPHSPAVQVYTPAKARNTRQPYGPCPKCEGTGRIVLMRDLHRVFCNVCEGTGKLNEFGCPERPDLSRAVGQRAEARA